MPGKQLHTRRLLELGQLPLELRQPLPARVLFWFSWPVAPLRESLRWRSACFGRFCFAGSLRFGRAGGWCLDGSLVLEACDVPCDSAQAALRSPPATLTRQQRAKLLLLGQELLEGVFGDLALLERVKGLRIKRSGCIGSAVLRCVVVQVLCRRRALTLFRWSGSFRERTALSSGRICACAFVFLFFIRYRSLERSGRPNVSILCIYPISI